MNGVTTLNGAAKERPILFSAPMVRAILAGKKTQTRRAIKKPERYDGIRECGFCCPYGQPGEGLWVRETFGYVSPHDGRAPIEECEIQYRADLPEGCTDQPGQWPADEARGYDEAPKWKPSIFMPRKASRISLKIAGARVERLQEISEADAKAEGVEPFPRDPEGDCWTDGLYKTAYNYLWCEINGWSPNAWDANPWVWVVEFNRIAPTSKG